MTKALDRRKRQASHQGMFTTDAELLALHIASLRAAKLAEGTISKRIYTINSVRRHIDPTPLLAATYQDLLAWQVTLANFTPGHIANTVCHVRGFYGWTVKPMRLLEISPADDLVLPRVPKGVPRPVTEFEYQAVQIAADSLGPHHPIAMWLKLARWAGCRCVEISRLSRDDVIPETPPRLRLTGKRWKVRVVFVARSLLADLAGWCDHTGRVFLKKNGAPYTPKEISDIGNDFIRSVGYSWTMHQLRHSFGTRSMETCRDARVVQTQMGHESMATTQLYVAENQAAAVELAEAQDAQLRAQIRRR